jgi:hypothetical protein
MVSMTAMSDLVGEEQASAAEVPAEYPNVIGELIENKSAEEVDDRLEDVRVLGSGGSVEEESVDSNANTTSSFDAVVAGEPIFADDQGSDSEARTKAKLITDSILQKALEYKSSGMLKGSVGGSANYKAYVKTRSMAGSKGDGKNPFDEDESSFESEELSVDQVLESSNVKVVKAFNSPGDVIASVEDNNEEAWRQQGDSPPREPRGSHFDCVAEEVELIYGDEAGVDRRFDELERELEIGRNYSGAEAFMTGDGDQTCKMDQTTSYAKAYNPELTWTSNDLADLTSSFGGPFSASHRNPKEDSFFASLTSPVKAGSGLLADAQGSDVLVSSEEINVGYTNCVPSDYEIGSSFDSDVDMGEGYDKYQQFQELKEHWEKCIRIEAGTSTRSQGLSKRTAVKRLIPLTPEEAKAFYKDILWALAERHGFELMEQKKLTRATPVKSALGKSVADGRSMIPKAKATPLLANTKVITPRLKAQNDDTYSSANQKSTNKSSASTNKPGITFGAGEGFVNSSATNANNSKMMSATKRLGSQGPSAGGAMKKAATPALVRGSTGAQCTALAKKQLLVTHEQLLPLLNSVLAAMLEKCNTNQSNKDDDDKKNQKTKSLGKSVEQVRYNIATDIKNHFGKHMDPAVKPRRTWATEDLMRLVNIHKTYNTTLKKLANFLPERDVKVPMIKPVKDFFEVARVLMQTVEAAVTSEVSADEGLGRVVMIRDQTNAWLGLQGEAILKSLSLEAISGKPAPEPLKQFKTSAALGSGAAVPVSSVARNKAAPAPVQKPKPTVPTARPNALSGNAERLSTARNTPSEKRAVATPVQAKPIVKRSQMKQEKDQASVKQLKPDVDHAVPKQNKSRLSALSTKPDASVQVSSSTLSVASSKPPFHAVDNDYVKFIHRVVEDVEEFISEQLRLRPVTPAVL